MPKKPAKKKTVKKKPVKKGASKLTKVKKLKKKPISFKAVAKIEKPIGKVVHYFAGIKVGIFKFKKPIKIGAKLKVSGATSNFTFKIGSMQFNYKNLKVAPTGKQIGVKLPKRARIGDEAFEVK